MRILFLSQIIPWPLDAGPKIKTWNVLKHLKASGYEVWFVSFVRPEEEKYVPPVKELCDQSFFVPLRRSRFRDVFYFIRSRITGRPFLVERDRLKKMVELSKYLLTEEKFDILHADQLTMTQFIAPLNRNGVRFDLEEQGKRVFDAHNATWKILKRAADESSIPTKWLYLDETQRLIHYEKALIKGFDHTLAVSEADRKSFTDLFSNEDDSSVNHKISVIPIGIDTDHLSTSHYQGGKKKYTLLTIGSLNYPPNADGIRWFIREVFPKVISQLPEVFLWVIGKNPPEDFYEIERHYPNNLKVTGYVEDLTPYFLESSLAIIPVKVGGGMRVRILECFAKKIPVITTTVGIEGIDAKKGQEVFIEDDPDQFAQKTVEILENELLQNNLIENAWKLVRQKYDWSVVLKKINSIYSSLVIQ